MARKIQEITWTQPGRDLGKVFVLKEMPATQGADLFLRVLFAMGKAGVPMPANVADMSEAGILAVGMDNINRIPWAEAKPMLDELDACIGIQWKNGVVPMSDGDVEEIATLIELRKMVVELHIGFFDAGAGPTSQPQRQESQEPTGLNMKISPVQ